MRRTLLHATLALALAGGTLGVYAVAEPTAFAQQLGGGQLGGEMTMRGGTVGIQNDIERHLFSSLICTCGCPRESLATCTCNVAADRRDALRAELGKGRSIEDLQAAYVKLYGPEALALPPNTGAHRLVWLFPLGAVVAGAVVAGVALRRWQRRGADEAPTNGGRDAPPAPTEPSKPAKRDEYDERLDDELRNLDGDDA
jgi:cytochrome c-type biogenesis protein CcmH/NrfF